MSLFVSYQQYRQLEKFKSSWSLDAGCQLGNSFPGVRSIVDKTFQSQSDSSVLYVIYKWWNALEIKKNKKIARMSLLLPKWTWGQGHVFYRIQCWCIILRTQVGKKGVICAKMLRIHLYEDLHMCSALHSAKPVYGDTVRRFKMMSGDFVGLDPSFCYLSCSFYRSASYVDAYKWNNKWIF